jgi:hypothetical protein
MNVGFILDLWSLKLCGGTTNMEWIASRDPNQSSAGIQGNQEVRNKTVAYDSRQSALVAAIPSQEYY